MPDWIPKNEFYPLSADGPEGDLIFKPFMSNSLYFEEPINDPLYSAHKEIPEIDVNTNETYIRYLADHPVKGVGCTQHVSQAPEST